MSNRLETIVSRQRTSRVQTLVFTALLALAAIVSASAVDTAVAVASRAHAIPR